MREKRDAEASAPTLPAVPLPALARTHVYEPTVAPGVLRPPVDLDVAKLDAHGFVERYTARELLGEGGMGEVRLFRDKRIGREVAMKLVLPGHGSRSDLQARFLREARVQGQLEHPAIVPVYDLGLNPEGAAYFTMKRVRGMTLEHVIAGLRKKDPVVTAKYSQRKLLAAFASVCLAIDFAHARGVLHRDLKPGNIMLGGFGEVYVLDWGVAKLGDTADPEIEDAVEAPLSSRSGTDAGAIIGTPGYMSPEQWRNGALDERSDVYSLGAILYEILTLQVLHAKGTVSEVLASTLKGVDIARVHTHTGDIETELQVVCTKATAPDPDGRFKTVHELHQAIERFLDGDRDLEQRRAMGHLHTIAARAAVARARTDETLEAEHRRYAMRELGRALAMDPTNAEALRTMIQLVAEPPKQIPADAQTEMDRRRALAMKVTSRSFALTYVSWLVYLPLILIMHVREWWPLLISAALIAVSTLITYVSYRREVSATGSAFGALICAALAVAFASRLFGPFILGPAHILAAVIGFGMHHPLRTRILATHSALMIGVVGPALLEWLGVLAPSYVFRDGVMIVVPHIAAFSKNTAFLCMTLSSIVIVITAQMFVGWTREYLGGLERGAQMQAWHFRQLAPDDAQAALTTEPTEAAASRPL